MTPVAITLKNLRVVASMSRESLCYTATVVVDGQTVGTIENEGRGGCSHLRPAERGPGRIHDLLVRATAFALAQTWEADGVRHPYPLLEEYVDDLAARAAHRKTLERDCKRTMKTYVLVLLDGKIMKAKRVPGVGEALRAMHGERIRFLDELPVDEAVNLYIEALSGPEPT